MRKFLFLVLTSGIVLLGCSKNNDNPASIVGTWNVNKITALTYLNNQPTGGDTTTEGNIKFDSNGGVSSTDSTGTTTGTYTYNTSSKLLTIISDSDTTEATVTNLTSNNLHFKEDQTQSINGYTIRLTVDADFSR